MGIEARVPYRKLKQKEKKNELSKLNFQRRLIIIEKRTCCPMTTTTTTIQLGRSSSTDQTR